MNRPESLRWLESIVAIVDHYRGVTHLSQTNLLEQITIANCYRHYGSDNFDVIALFQRVQEERNLYLKKSD